jgi:hypothetical protein
MSLAKVQQLLAQLYTDRNFREQFFADPITASASFDLTATEIFQLQQLNAQQVNYFARSLHNKRRREAGSFLPRSAAVLQANFDRWFWQYVDTDGAKTDKSPINDAIEFTRFLLQQLPLANRHSPTHYLREVIIYEQTCLIANQQPRYLAARWFHYSIADLRQPLADSSQTTTPAVNPHWTLGLWWRLTTKMPLRHYLLTLR